MRMLLEAKREKLTIVQYWKLTEGIIKDFDRLLLKFFFLVENTKVLAFTEYEHSQ